MPILIMGQNLKEKINIDVIIYASEHLNDWYLPNYCDYENNMLFNSTCKDVYCHQNPH